MKNSARAFVNPFVVCLVVCIGFGTTIGLGTVWMRHQIGLLLKSQRDLVAETERVERMIREKVTLIESEQTPEKLRALNAAMQLGLVPMNEVPVLHVADNVVDRMARRAHRELFQEGAAPAAVTFRLAVR